MERFRKNKVNLLYTYKLISIYSRTYIPNIIIKIFIFKLYLQFQYKTKKIPKKTSQKKPLKKNTPKKKHTNKNTAKKHTNKNTPKKTPKKTHPKKSIHMNNDKNNEKKRINTSQALNLNCSK
jgi:hypothetical protein